MSEQILSLKKADASILLIEERPRTDIIIAAPHHAIGGEPNMPCPEHRDSDENTGFIARKIAEQIKVSSIIACNYRIDPNKNLRTDYSLQISQWEPKYLIEIHGHGAKIKKGEKRPDDLTIEVSSGSQVKNSHSINFSKVLKRKFGSNQDLKNYKVCGDFTFIHFKAKNTATITDNRWISFHIELPPSLRKNKNDNLPDFTDTFIQCLAETILEVCR